MSLFPSVLRQTCTVLVVGFSRHHPWCRPIVGFQRAVRVNDQLSTSRTRHFSSFQAPEPPQSNGQAVYKDIDFSVEKDRTSQSAVRNADPGAVFVVSGASRGIGLQFVKSLLEQTKVSTSA